MRLRFGLAGFFLCFLACTNIEDAKPSTRRTFIHIYEAAHNLYGVSAEPIEGGYLILGNETLANGNQNGVIIQTNALGEKTTGDILLEGGPAKGMTITSDGYYVLGDSVKINVESSEVSVSDLFVYSARMFKLDRTGNILKKLVMADRADTINITDIHGGAVTTNAQGEIIVLGTFKKAGLATTERPFLTGLNPATLDTLWTKTYDVLDRDYVNSKSVQVAPSGRIIWASALLKDNQNFSRSYIGIPYILENSTFENFSQFGEQSDQQLYANDIQPAEFKAIGFGIVGTYATASGTNGNMFFMRVDERGNIIQGSERYFDGVLSANNGSVTSGQSESADTGDALTSTSDGGFVLAGSMTSTLNGKKDIFLVKVDGQGTMLWSKVVGGAGDETVSSIRETENGGLLICGSNNASGLSSIFIVKTDKNGELRD